MEPNSIARVANQVVEHWRDTMNYRLGLVRVVCHGPATSSYDEVQSRQFSVGIDDELTNVSFHDLLLIYLYLDRKVSNPDQAEIVGPMKVRISEDDEHGLFQQITERCCFEFRAG